MKVEAVEIDGQVQEQIRADAVASYPQEACGMLIGRVEAGAVYVRHALPCPNEAPAAQRTQRFEIDPRAVLNVQRALRPAGQEIIGFYHSHPNGSPDPSRMDLEYMSLWPDTVWLIAGVDAEAELEMRAWWLSTGALSAVRELSISGVAASGALKCS